MRFKKIYIEITNVCNKNCSFCSTSSREKKEMSLREFEHILKEIKPYTRYIYLHIKGEPLIHSKFIELLNLCDKYEISVNITTNAEYLDKYKKEIVNSKCIRQVNISIQAVDDSIKFKEILNATDYIQENSKIYIVYRYWALNDVILDIKKHHMIKTLIEHYNSDKETIEKICNMGNIKIKENMYLNKAKRFNWPKVGSNIEKNGNCNGLKTHIGILSDGTVVPCCLDSEGVINLGNIFTESLNEILSKDKVNSIIKNFNDGKRIETLCASCDFM